MCLFTVCSQDLSRASVIDTHSIARVDRRARDAGAHRPAVVLEVLDEAAEHGRVRVQLDLAGAVQQQVVILAVPLNAVWSTICRVGV